ncbi:unnamed protein product [Hanseniaspora opuntiae]
MTSNKDSVPSEANESFTNIDDNDVKDNGNESDMPPLNTENDEDNEQGDADELISEDEDAISKFYKDNNIKEGELLKTIVSQAISEPMEIPKTETLTRYPVLRNSIPSTISLKRSRQVVSEDDDRELDEDDIRSIEETFRKRAKTTEGKYRVVKMYVKDINKGDLAKHPALTNPDDEDEEIEYVTLVREKLVTNPTDEVIVISSDDEGNGESQS